MGQALDSFDDFCEQWGFTAYPTQSGDFYHIRYGDSGLGTPGNSGFGTLIQVVYKGNVNKQKYRDLIILKYFNIVFGGG